METNFQFDAPKLLVAGRILAIRRIQGDGLLGIVIVLVCLLVLEIAAVPQVRATRASIGRGRYGTAVIWQRAGTLAKRRASTARSHLRKLGPPS